MNEEEGTIVIDLPATVVPDPPVTVVNIDAGENKEGADNWQTLNTTLQDVMGRLGKVEDRLLLAEQEQNFQAQVLIPAATEFKTEIPAEVMETVAETTETENDPPEIIQTEEVTEPDAREPSNRQNSERKFHFW